MSEDNPTPETAQSSGNTETPATRSRPRGELQAQLREAKRLAQEAAGQGDPADDPADTPEVAPRAPSKPPMRSAQREEDPRARAARRTAELLDHGDLPDEGPDNFYLDRDIIPPGWDYEWKTLTVYNKEDPAYQVRLAQGGWEPVPADRHPEFMPINSKSATIVREGMVLMERPMEITKRVRMRDQQRARAQVRQKEEQLSTAPKGQFNRDNKGDSLARVGKSYEPLPIPQD